MRAMRFAKLTPIVAILALAACDNEPATTAEAPVVEDEAILQEETAVVEDDTAIVEEETALAEEPVAGDAETEVTVVEPETGTTSTQTETAATEIDPVVEDTGEAEVTVITPDDETQTAATGTNPAMDDTSTGDTTGAISATTAAMVEPGAYASDQLSLELAEAGTFTLTGPDGDAVEGDWRVFGDTLTLSNAEGATGDATFPMTCTVAEDGEGFRVSAQTSSCEMLDGQVFQPQG